MTSSCQQLLVIFCVRPAASASEKAWNKGFPGKGP